jgi:hypothetical protein
MNDQTLRRAGDKIGESSARVHTNPRRSNVKRHRKPPTFVRQLPGWGIGGTHVLILCVQDSLSHHISAEALDKTVPYLDWTGAFMFARSWRSIWKE